MKDLNKFKLINKTALITGAGGFLGFYHAEAILEVGGSVILTDIDEKNLFKNYKKLIRDFESKKIFYEVLDVTNEQKVKEVSNKFTNDRRRIDILINNASINPSLDNNRIFKKSRVENYDLNDWDLNIKVGLTGTFICSKVFGHAMTLDKMGGVILNIASDLSIISPDNRLYNEGNIDKNKANVKPIVYSVVKTGLIGLTRYLATYWAENNIRCNAISPGGVFNNQDQNFIKKIKKLIPLGRLANKDEYKSSVQFLCSEASSYMTGQNIVIDGGRSVW